jgi:hypothetical protein
MQCTSTVMAAGASVERFYNAAIGRRWLERGGARVMGPRVRRRLTGGYAPRGSKVGAR